MPYVLCYIRPGIGLYPDCNYPGHTAHMCDWEHAMHLAISDDGEHFVPLRNGTGVLFARCTFNEGDPAGTTKTLIDPWLARSADGAFLVCALRRNRNAPDPLSVGSIMLFTSRDLVRYDEAGFLRVADEEIRHPRCRYDAQRAAYYLEWEQQGSTLCGYSADLRTVQDIHPCVGELSAASDFGIEGCIPGNVLAITEEEAMVVRGYLDEICHVGVEPMVLSLPLNAKVPAEELPMANCLYSDGSVHSKPVKWDMSALAAVDTSVPGEYHIPGTILQKRWPFPMELSGESGIMSDPCVTKWQGKYYLSSSGEQNITLRCADTIEGTFSAPPTVVYRVPLGELSMMGTWAAELHDIDGTLYMFTSYCPNGEWTQVKSVVLRCKGDPMQPSDWEEAHYCVKPGGQLLTEGGISLDMTYFRDGGRDYVMWSDRKMHYDVQPPLPEPADIYIATVDPARPWQLTSEPVCVTRPIYGWDRMETEVVEAPYLLRRGDTLFVTISGSSTSMADLYDVGLLSAKTGSDLLDPASWDRLAYPLLTKESIPGEYGPGHNNFIRDPETGDDLMIYHAVPHDAQGVTLQRRPGIRRVHWAATGLPYLEMTAERDLAPELADVTLTLHIG